MFKALLIIDDSDYEASVYSKRFFLIFVFLVLIDNVISIQGVYMNPFIELIFNKFNLLCVALDKNNFK